MSRAWLVALGAASTIVPRAAAQSAAAFRDSAIRISAEMVLLRDSLFDRDSTATEVVRRGSFVIAASPRQRANAAKALEDFLAAKLRWFGAAVPSPDGFRIVVRSTGNRDVFHRFGRPVASDDEVVLVGLPDTGSSFRAERNASPKDLGAVLVQSYAEIMFHGLGAGVRQWLENPPLFQMDEHERRYLAMYASMISSGKAGTGCLAGRVDHCAFALGLRAAPSADLTDTYPSIARADFFMSVLGRGGPEAWIRLAAAHSSRAEDALAAAGAQSIDTLISTWRAGIVGLRPAESPLKAGALLLAAGWAVGILLGTLTASRWR